MPYVQKLSEDAIEEQFHQWDGVMHDPYIDGFNGWACKQKLYKFKFMLDDMIAKAPGYAGEVEWLLDRKIDIAEKKLAGKR